ncbi:MAG: hypothetical protein NTW21_14590 [Verrucomicrobia bacterium]|nr:hypothetical protein [Verrucomicrobiota bacterium]
MIPVPRLTPANEPPHFNVNCRQLGATFLAETPPRDPHEKSAWWSEFQPDLAKHFSYRCGWTAMVIGLDGDVDHYLACGDREGRPSPHRNLAFEWTDYRFASGTVNSRKGNLDDQILDPCKIGDGWFEVLLPNFVLRPTNRLPDELRAKAETTIKKLKLFNEHKVRFTRWSWYQRYWNGGEPLLGQLEMDAPLVAAAVKKALAAGEALPDPSDCLPGYEVKERKRAYARRRACTKKAAQAPPGGGQAEH